MLYSTLFLIVIFSSQLAVNAQDCFLDLSKADVLVIRLDDTIAFPAPNNNASVRFTFNEYFMLNCPAGTTSPLISDGGNKVRCKGGTALEMWRPDSRANYTWSDFKCVQKHSAIVKNTNKKCQYIGTQIQIGFEMSDDFATVYTVCFDLENFVVLNVTFNSTFEEWGEFSNETTEYSFIDDGHLYKDTDLDILYSLNTQKMSFGWMGVVEYITDEVYLIKGLMLPSYLGTYSPFNNVWFNYANTVPQWSTLRNVFAEFVNNFIMGLKVKPKSYEVGTFDVATLNNSLGDKVTLYLDLNLSSNDKTPNRIPIPKWLWFTFKGSFTIYGYNNPYYEESEVEAEFNDFCALPFSFEKFKDMLVGVCAGVPVA